MRRAALLSPLFFLAAASSSTADSALAGIHARLAPLRATHAVPAGQMRSATPALTPVKHALRDWIEQSLAALPEDGDERALTVRLNEALGASDLFCDTGGRDRCDFDRSEWNGIGFAGRVSVERPGWDRLTVITGLGIYCGFDESAYAYRWHDGGWRRFWQQEQPIEPGKPYQPRHVVSVEVGQDEDPLVLSLGTASWCTSNWRQVYYSLSRAQGADAPRLLLDRSESAFLGAHDIPIRGSVGADDALIEFASGSLDSDVFITEAVRHFTVRSDPVERIDPVALAPRGFVEQWLESAWELSSGWSATGAADALAPWHRRLHRDTPSGGFVGDTRRCKDPTLWQVGVTFDDSPGRTYWFTVRWTPPYVFRMAAVSDRADPGCAEPDAQADTYRTLFPVGDWH